MSVMSDKEVIEYMLRLDPETGFLYWRWPDRNHDPRKPAGHVSKQGYRRIYVLCKKYLAHRIVWLLFTGAWPKGEIDHINGNKDDNRPCNLRDVTAAENTAAYWESKRNANTGSTSISGLR